MLQKLMAFIHANHFSIRSSRKCLACFRDYFQPHPVSIGFDSCHWHFFQISFVPKTQLLISNALLLGMLDKVSLSLCCCYFGICVDPCYLVFCVKAADPRGPVFSHSTAAVRTGTESSRCCQSALVRLFLVQLESKGVGCFLWAQCPCFTVAKTKEGE